MNPDHLESYRRDGYLILRHFLTEPQTTHLYETALQDEAVKKNAIDLNDQQGRKTRLSLWFTPGRDVFGYLVRSRKMLETAARLMETGLPICHFHSKIMQKEPRVGGAWEWHQDYGYWYKDQFMFPDQLISVMIALSPSNPANGCLQVIRGSHKMGRVNHGFAGEQVGADMVMVSNALKTMELVYAILEPGDALFFHPNLLHRSEANLSADSRWSIISCYCAAANLAYNESSSSWHIPLEPVPDEAMLEWDSESLGHNDFLRKENDPALKETGWEQG